MSHVFKYFTARVWLRRLLKSADGATAVEYGVQLAAVVIAVVLGANMLGVNMSATFTKVDDALGNAMDRKSTVTTTTLSGSSR